MDSHASLLALTFAALGMCVNLWRGSCPRMRLLTARPWACAPMMVQEAKEQQSLMNFRTAPPL